jgi:GNAT superfamily N-acetyltransferase
VDLQPIEVGSMSPYSVRDATADEQRELTRLCVRATMQAGYDEAFIDRVMPGLTITVPLIAGGFVQVAQEGAGEVVGVVTVTPTTLQGIALLYGIYVDPAHWKRGVGRVLFGSAAARAKSLKAGALTIYAEPSAEGFYKRMGAIRIGEVPMYYSPEIVLPHLLYILPENAASGANR